MELPIYNDFKNYQFLDVLEALSLRMLVKEQLKKQKSDRQQLIEDSDFDAPPLELKPHSSSIQRNIIENEEVEIRKQIERDIYTLKLNDQFKNVADYKQVIEGESSVHNQRKEFKVDKMTILHAKAAQVVVNQLKFLSKKRKIVDRINNLGHNNQESRNEMDEEERKVSYPVEDQQQSNNDQIFETSNRNQSDKKPERNFRGMKKLFYVQREECEESSDENSEAVVESSRQGFLRNNA